MHCTRQKRLWCTGLASNGCDARDLPASVVMHGTCQQPLWWTEPAPLWWTEPSPLRCTGPSPLWCTGPAPLWCTGPAPLLCTGPCPCSNSCYTRGHTRTLFFTQSNWCLVFLLRNRLPAKPNFFQLSLDPPSTSKALLTPHHLEPPIPCFPIRQYTPPSVLPGFQLSSPSQCNLAAPMKLFCMHGPPQLV